jgi:hypothetical protein
MTITKANLEQFEQEGYFVGEGILDPDVGPAAGGRRV